MIPEKLRLSVGEISQEIEKGSVLGIIQIESGSKIKPDGTMTETAFRALDGILAEMEFCELPDFSVRLGDKYIGTQNGPGIYRITFNGRLIVDSRPEHYDEIYTYGLEWLGPKWPIKGII